MRSRLYIITILCLAVCLLRDTADAKTGPAQPSSHHDIQQPLIRLQWAEKEVRGIADGLHGRAFCRRMATEDVFKRKAPQAGIIHLATHAIVDDENPLYSKLVFAEDAASSEDGFLNTFELYNMKLNARLVVLSACNTGYGKVVHGEGIMSLARGFMYAGCPCIVMSLWPVDDQSTAGLMKGFFSGLAQGLRKDTALRQTKLDYLKQADAVQSNPFYWAGFVSIGNTHPIPIRMHKNHPTWLLMGIVATLVLVLLFWGIQVKKTTPLKMTLGILMGTGLVVFIHVTIPRTYSQTEAEIVPADTLRANAHCATAQRWVETSEFDSAVVYFDKARAIYEAEKKYDRILICLNGIGEMLTKKGAYQEAEQQLNHASEIGRRYLGEEHPEVAQTYANLGIVYYLRGEYDRALDVFHRALNIRLNVMGKNHPLVAKMYNNLAIIYGYIKGDYDKALEFFNQSLAIQLEQVGQTHADVAALYNNMGNIYHVKKDFQRALSLAHKSLTIKRELLGENHIDVATSYNNIGLVYEDMTEYDEAIAHYRKALAIERDILGQDHPNIALYYHNIGCVYHKKGDDRRAITHLTRALSLRHRVFGEKHPDLAVSYQELGKVFLRQQSFDQALESYQKSIIALVDDFNEHDIYKNPPLQYKGAESKLLVSLELKAEALEKRFSTQSKNIRDIQMSIRTFELASALIDRMSCGYEAEGSKILLGERAHDIYEKAIHAALVLYETTQDEQCKEKAFAFAEKSKAGVLRQILLEGKARQFAGIPEHFLKQESELKDDLASLTKSLFEERQKGGQADSAQIIQWQDRLFTRKREYESLIRQFEKEYPDYYNLKYRVTTASSRDIQENILDDQTTLVEYFIGDERIVIFTITRAGLDIISEMKNDHFEEQITCLRTGLIERDYSLYTKNAHALYRTLIEPVKNNIVGKNLIVIPDGILGYIPFEALITEKPRQTDEDYRQLAYLIYAYQTTYSYSSTLLLENTKEDVYPGNHSYVGFAPVVFHH